MTEQQRWAKPVDELHAAHELPPDARCFGNVRRAALLRPAIFKRG